MSFLQSFCAVVDYGSFSGAAQVLGITQPAVSQQMKALEKEYGTELLHRDGPTVVPTEAGTIVYEHALQILKLYEESKQRVRCESDELTGRLTVGASTGLGESFLPRVMVRFRASHPQTHVQLHVSDSDSILERIVQHKFDLGFVGTARRDARLHFEPFVTDRLVLVVAADHELAGTSAIDQATFFKMPLVVQQAGSGAMCALREALTKEGIDFDRLSIALEVGLQESTKSAVLGGCGGTIVPRLGAVEQLRDGSLVEVAIEDLSLKQTFYVAYRRSWPLSRLAQAFLADTKAALRQAE